MSDVTRPPVRPREPRERGGRAPQKSFRLSEKANDQLRFIMVSTGFTKTQVVEQALDMLYQELLAKLKGRHR